jgi:hypothetical protein
MCYGSKVMSKMTKCLIIATLFLVVFISSCLEKKQKENKSIAQISKVTNHRTNIIRYKKSGVLDTLFANGTPKITSLPFWSKGWPRPGKKFHIEKKCYRLPIIKSIKYMNLDSIFSYVCTYGEPIDSSIVKLTKYNYKFPNIDKYQVFYRWVSGGSYANDPMIQFINKNCNIFYTEYGYLILYDPLAMNAIVLNVSNFYYIDADEERDFFIDKNNNIHLIDRSWTDGDEDANGNQTAEYLGAHKRIISIFKNGEIKIIDNK